MIQVNVISANVRKEHALHGCHGAQIWISLSTALAVIDHKDGAVIVLPSGDESLLVEQDPEDLLSRSAAQAADNDP